jgi:hypothetical protein
MAEQQASAQQEDIGPVSRSVAQHSLLDALNMCATKASADNSAAEAKDWAAASLQFAQAIVMLDPQRLAGGDTPQSRKSSLPDPAVTPPATKDADRDGRIGE